MLEYFRVMGIDIMVELKGKLQLWTMLWKLGERKWA